MKKILLIATGGTIASRKTEHGLSPQLTPEELLSFIPKTREFCIADSVQPLNVDSTNIQPEHWLLLAKCIENQYKNYDGFVICHGTDTMAYTASALSYLIQHSQKPIVLTGSQRPMDAESTDAKINLTDSLQYACRGDGGVCLVFGGHVIAGTRARKVRTKSYDAFTSLNFPELASIRDGKIIRYIPGTKRKEPHFFHSLNTNVGVLKLIPGMLPQTFSAVGSLCDGLIMESYGVGGIPELYLDVLDKLVQDGKTIVMSTQVPQEGSDLSVYRVGRTIKQRYHLLETRDMTLESSVTKLMWVLGQTKKPEEIRKLFQKTINHDLLF